MKVIILRAGSGAGKSTWIKTYNPGAVIFSADQFFMVDGEYKFDVTKLPEAHATCLRSFIAFCQNPPEGVNTVIVDNTNTTVAELAPYAQVALVYGHELQLYTFVYDPAVAFKRNTHGTPLKGCIEMHARLQEQTKFLPPWWKHDYIIAE